MRPDDRLASVRPSRGTVVLKRLLDFIGSALVLIILMPVLIAVGIIIKLDSPGPIFFRQERLGLGGRTFRILKFRSMVAGAADTGTALTVGADSRITPAGMFLR